MKKPRRAKKMLLVASAGLATLTLSGCGITSGNLVAPPECGEDGGYCPDAGRDAGDPPPTDAGERDSGR